ncbi:MAG TPA: ATP-binding protein [Clostridiales bacterium]|nr:ATP-binding protein [Clostridiales bacterium]
MRDNLLIELLKEYEAYRIQQLEILKKREAEVLAAIPELAELRHSLVTCLAQKAKAMILNPDMSEEETRYEDLVKRTKEKEALLLKENGYPEDYLTLQYRCPECRDTGYVGELVKEKCSCLIQKIVERSYRYSELSGISKENFDTFNPEVIPDTPLPGKNLTQREYMLQLKSVLWDYQAAYPHNTKKNILFTGKTGLGKTFMLNCLAKAILDKGFTVLKITSYNLFEHLFRNMLDSTEGDSMLLKDRIFEVDALIIDDLGTETRRNNFTAEELFNILNERYLQQKHTFISTNLSLTDLRDYYSDRVTSRLFDTQNTMIFRFEGKDLRLRAKN